MGENFDINYKQYKNFFGNFPEEILIKYADNIPECTHVLDIGAGQGRNSIYLAERDCIVDAVDSSQTAIDILNKKQHQNINYIKQNIDSFRVPDNYYSAILMFGIIQLLNWDVIKGLVENIKSWTMNGGLIFVTAFGIGDDKYNACKNNWAEIGKNSFESDDKRIRTFLEPDEILKIFSGFEIIHHWEGLGKKHRHGDGPVEQHSMVELVARKHD